MERDFREPKHGRFNSIIISLEEDAILEVRSIYTIWDVLGDIGGLIDMLRLLVMPIVTLLNFSFSLGINPFLL